MKERLQAILDALEDNDNSAAWLIAKHALGGEEKREPDAWKPIETAPKSPDWVLLGYFQDYMPGKYQGGHPVIAYWSGDTWVDCCGRRLRIFSPTHWMPIPKPSIAPPQVPGSASAGEPDAPHCAMPADGAAPCPTCQMPAYNKGKGVRFFVGKFPCADSWHDSTPIAPPQVKSEPEKVAEEDAPQPGQPADGAAQCPSCKSTLRETRFWVSARHGGETPCWHSWHDYTPAAPNTGRAEATSAKNATAETQDVPDDAAGGGDTPVTDAMFTCSCSWDEAAIRHWSKPAAHFIDLSRMLERQRDAALRELNELKSKLAQIANDQYCTPRDK